MSLHEYLTLQIEVLSPLHIGDGQKLLRDLDYIVQGNTTYMLDQQRFFDWAVPDENELPGVLMQGKPGDLLGSYKASELDIFRYRMSGAPEKQELRSHIKDLYGQPYIPGSTLKGMLRTAFIWGIYTVRNDTPDLSRLGKSRSWAGQAIERHVMGHNPNYDLFRAVQVSDSSPAGLDAMRVLGTQIYPTGQGNNQGVIVDVEAVREETTFYASLTTDLYGFQNEEAATLLNWQKKDEWLRYIVPFCRDFARMRLRQEIEYYRDRDDVSAVRSFYRKLADIYQKLGENQFIAQLGWGAGWTSKTLNNLLLGDERAFARLVQQYRIRGRHSSSYTAGMEFPRSRNLVRYQGRLVRPMGWVQVTVN